MSRVRISREQEIRLDLAELARKCRLAASEDILDWMAREVESDEKSGLMGEGWPSKGGKKGKDDSNSN